MTEGRRRGRASIRIVSAVTIVAALCAVFVAPGTGAGAAVKLDNGVGTKAALDGPQCDETFGENGRIEFIYPFWLPCVTPWKDGAKNGGATAPGVTADSIKVVVRQAPDAEIQRGTAPVRDRATGGFGTVAEAVADATAMFEHVYETWGRKIEFEVYEQSGTDEAAQRADAIAIAAKKPFAVLELGGSQGGGEVFLTTMTQKKILAFSPTTGTNQKSIEQSPYRWTAGPDYATNALLGAQFISKSLVGKPAEFAGSDDLKTKKRVFGVVRDDSPNAPDLTAAFKEITKGGGKIALELTYTPPLDPAQHAPEAGALAPTLITRMKDAGVTSMLVLSPYQMTGALTKAATAQDFHPEWITMGYGLVDIAVLSRTFDQEQWSHAFGTLALQPPVLGAGPGPSEASFNWYWGTNQGAYNQAIITALEMLYSGIHMSGPKLTAESVKAGIFARPRTGGAAEGQVTSVMRAYGNKGGLPYEEYMTGGDAALAWWDPQTSGPSISATTSERPGVWQFLDGGKRFLSGDAPKKLPAFFEPAESLYKFDALPASDAQPPYTCTGCPSTGAAS